MHPEILTTSREGARPVEANGKVEAEWRDDVQGQKPEEVTTPTLCAPTLCAPTLCGSVARAA